MERPEAWLYRVAMNLAKSRLRRRLAERRAKERLQGRADRTTHDPDATDEIAVREAISTLPHRQRAVLLLHYYQGLTFREVAEILDVSQGTAKSIAHRATERLRREFEFVDSKEATHVP